MSIKLGYICNHGNLPINIFELQKNIDLNVPFDDESDLKQSYA